MMQNQKSVKNALLSVLNQTVLLLIPLIIAPYTARVLGLVNIGQYSYAVANCSYFLLIQNWGFGLYGSLNVAKSRNAHKALNEIFWQTVYAKSSISAICMLAYVFFCAMQPRETMLLNVCVGMALVVDAFDINWLYVGLEEYSCVFRKSIFIKIFSIISILLLVKNGNDLILYALILQVLSLIGTCFYWLSVKKYITSIDKPNLKKMIRCFLQSAKYFVTGIATTIFHSADKTILGSFSSIIELGYYEQATKLTECCLGVIYSIGNVFLPHTAHLEATNKNEEAEKIKYRLVAMCVMLSAPLTLGSISVADSLVTVFFGEEYGKSAVLLKILSGYMAFTAVSNIISQQFMVVGGRQKQYNIALIISSFMNVVLNYIAVLRYDSIGVSMSTVIVSFALLVFVILGTGSTFSVRKAIRQSYKYVLAAFAMYVILCWMPIFSTPLLTLMTRSTIGVSVYFALLYFMRDAFVVEGIQYIAETIKKLAPWMKFK